MYAIRSYYELIELARAGLAARGRLNASGDNETGFLSPLYDVAATARITSYNVCYTKLLRRFITAHYPYLPFKPKPLFGLFNLYLKLIQIPGIDGDCAHLLAVAKPQLPLAVAEFKSNVQNRLRNNFV